MIKKRPYRMSDVFKIKVEYEGDTLHKEKCEGLDGLKKVFKKLEFKLK
jgi:hypothetical protein